MCTKTHMRVSCALDGKRQKGIFLRYRDLFSGRGAQMKVGKFAQVALPRARDQLSHGPTGHRHIWYTFSEGPAVAFFIQQSRMYDNTVPGMEFRRKTERGFFQKIASDNLAKIKYTSSSFRLSNYFKVYQ